MKEKRESKTWRIDEEINTLEMSVGDTLLIPDIGLGHVYDIADDIRVAFPQIKGPLVDIWYETPRTGLLEQRVLGLFSQESPGYERIMEYLEPSSPCSFQDVMRSLCFPGFMGEPTCRG